MDRRVREKHSPPLGASTPALQARKMKYYSARQVTRTNFCTRLTEKHNQRCVLSLAYPEFILVVTKGAHKRCEECRISVRRVRQQ